MVKIEKTISIGWSIMMKKRDQISKSLRDHIAGEMAPTILTTQYLIKVVGVISLRHDVFPTYIYGLLHCSHQIQFSSEIKHMVY